MKVPSNRWRGCVITGTLFSHSLHSPGDWRETGVVSACGQEKPLSKGTVTLQAPPPPPRSVILGSWKVLQHHSGQLKPIHSLTTSPSALQGVPCTSTVFFYKSTVDLLWPLAFSLATCLTFWLDCFQDLYHMEEDQVQGPRPLIVPLAAHWKRRVSQDVLSLHPCDTSWSFV